MAVEQDVGGATDQVITEPIARNDPVAFTGLQH